MLGRGLSRRHHLRLRRRHQHCGGAHRPADGRAGVAIEDRRRGDDMIVTKVAAPRSERGFEVPACWRSGVPAHRLRRSEEHTSELQSLMRISFAVFCLKKKKQETTAEHN